MWARLFLYAVMESQKGLLTRKKATFIIATGGVYDAQTQMASCSTLWSRICGRCLDFLGVTDATFSDGWRGLRR